MITLEEAKAYLRVDSSMEDSLIESLLQSAEKLTADVARITVEEWDTLWNDETETMTVRGEEITSASLVQLRSLLHTDAFYPGLPLRAQRGSGPPCAGYDAQEPAVLCAGRGVLRWKEQSPDSMNA